MEHDILALLVEAHRLITEAWEETGSGDVADLLVNTSDELKRAMTVAMYAESVED
jgi:hypothetical protein